MKDPKLSDDGNHTEKSKSDHPEASSLESFDSLASKFLNKDEFPLEKLKGLWEENKATHSSIESLSRVKHLLLHLTSNIEASVSNERSERDLRDQRDFYLSYLTIKELEMAYFSEKGKGNKLGILRPSNINKIFNLKGKIERSESSFVFYNSHNPEDDYAGLMLKHSLETNDSVSKTAVAVAMAHPQIGVIKPLVINNRSTDKDFEAYSYDSQRCEELVKVWKERKLDNLKVEVVTALRKYFNDGPEELSRLYGYLGQPNCAGGTHIKGGVRVFFEDPEHMEKLRQRFSNKHSQDS